MQSKVMRLLVIFQLLMVTVYSSAATADLVGILMVELRGLKDASGNVYIAVYNSDATWLGDDTVLDKKVVIAEALDGELVRTELQLPLGDYALSVFYDRNDNGELDTNFIGMPKEPIALSNNAKAKFGPPKYEDAVFTLGVEPIIQTISIKEL